MAKFRRSILVVSFAPAGRKGYPHIDDVVELLAEAAEVERIRFRERGYFLERILNTGAAGWFGARFPLTLALVLLDTARLWWKARKFHVVLAVDELTFVCASKVHGNVVLWSHDIVTSDQRRAGSIVHRMLKDVFSTAFFRSGSRVVIQDESRLKLFESAHPGLLGKTIPYFLPVGCKGSPVHPRGPGGKMLRPLLMQIGGISERRSGSESLLAAFARGSGEFRLVFHGFVHPTFRQALQVFPIPAIVSDHPVEPSQIGHLVSQADIGFVGYCAEDENFRHVSHASGQLAHFLACGKPVIAWGNTDIGEHLERYGAGLAIGSMDDLLPAIQKLSDSYDLYSEAAWRLHIQQYDPSQRSKGLCEWLLK